MEKQSGVKYARTECHLARRKSALNRLQTQLEKGTKPNKKGKGPVPLTDKDKKRITKEIEILKTRI